MNDRPHIVRAQVTFSHPHAAWHLWVTGIVDQKRVIGSMRWDEVGPDALRMDCDPALQMDESEAQALMNSLWDAGLRPTQGHGSTGQCAALQAHIEDLRHVAKTLLVKVCDGHVAPNLPMSEDFLDKFQSGDGGN